MLPEQPPRLAVTVDPMRPDPFHHLGDEQVGQLLLAALAVQSQLDRRLHITADRLAIHPHQPLYRPEPRTSEPHPQHFANLEHAYLPEGHRRSSIR